MLLVRLQGPDVLFSYGQLIVDTTASGQSTVRFCVEVFTELKGIQVELWTFGWNVLEPNSPFPKSLVT